LFGAKIMSRSTQLPHISPSSLSLEEQLHRAHDHFVLLADLFHLQAVARDDGEGQALAAPALLALTEGCREAAQRVRDLLNVLPADLMNWTPADRGIVPARKRRL
jgi:hypothetical protein